MLLDSLGGGNLDAIDSVGELRLHIEHLYRTKEFLQLLTVGIEQTYLFAYQTSYYQARFDTGEASGFDDEGFVADDGLAQSRPFHIGHPRDDVDGLLLWL